MKRVLIVIPSYSKGGGAEKILSNILNNGDFSEYQIDIVEIDSEFDLPLLTACEYKGCLGYEFYVKKPEKYVFVFKEDNFLERKNIKSLENYGISFLKVNEFKNSIREGQVYSHEFIFLQEGAQDKLGELGECFYKTHNDKQTNRK